MLLCALILIVLKNDKSEPESLKNEIRDLATSKRAVNEQSTRSTTRSRQSSSDSRPSQAGKAALVGDVFAIARQARSELKKLKPSRAFSKEEMSAFRDEFRIISQMENSSEKIERMEELQEQRQERMSQRREQSLAEAEKSPEAAALRLRLQQIAELDQLLRRGRSFGGSDDFDRRLSAFAATVDELREEELQAGISGFREEVFQLRQVNFQARQLGKQNPNE